MASVFIGDLDDFIGPSQACVNPIFAGPSSTAPAGGSQQNGDSGDAGATAQTQVSAACVMPGPSGFG